MNVVRDIFAVIGLFALLPLLIHIGEAYGPPSVVGACQDFRRYLRWRNGVEDFERPEDPIMVRYNPAAGYGEDDQEWVKITELVVPRDFDKQQLLAAIEYLHYSRDIDTDYIPVNALVHLYENPELIVVRG